MRYTEREERANSAPLDRPHGEAKAAAEAEAAAAAAVAVEAVAHHRHTFTLWLTTENDASLLDERSPLYPLRMQHYPELT